MGKAMMGTGEAEGENRAMVATEMALNNPLIDEYSLQGAKGLLVNITGGSDITLFEVDQAVNKIRAEVDPEAELIFGAIKDENMNGKIRVSIVATALDGHKPEAKTVLNMVTRIQNRNNGYSEGLFSHNTRVENNTFNSIDGANALKLDESYEFKTEEQNATANNFESKTDIQPLENNFSEEELLNEIPSGVSIENASYIENSNDPVESINNISGADDKILEEYTPKLFSDEQNIQEETVSSEPTDPSEYDNSNTEQLFDQDINEDEDFEIPAFLRKQKF
jgi:cell division protein FtsZ